MTSGAGDFSRSFTKDHLLGRIRATLERSAPVDFSSLSATSQQAVVDFYGRLQGGTSGEPVNQNRTAVALILSLPELAGTDRSFPFALDPDDRTRATVASAAFDRGAAGLTDDTEIRSFVHTQREEIIRGIPQAEKVRLCTRLLRGYVDDSDLVALQRIYQLSTPPNAPRSGCLQRQQAVGPDPAVVDGELLQGQPVAPGRIQIAPCTIATACFARCRGHGAWFAHSRVRRHQASINID